MEISWFNEKPKNCVVTLNPGNLTLNKTATSFFENAYSVMLGMDIEKRWIIIKPLLKAEALRHDIPENKKYRITVRSSYSRVTNKAFIDEVLRIFSLECGEKPPKFVANWLAKEQILVVDLKEEV